MDNLCLTECFLQTRNSFRFTKQGFEENESLDDLAYAFTGEEHSKLKPQIILDDADIREHQMIEEPILEPKADRRMSHRPKVVKLIKVVRLVKTFGNTETEYCRPR